MTLPVKIMLFSADLPMAHHITACLSASGYQVIRRLDGLAALDAIQAEKPSLVILDIELPGLNSLAIIRAIRSEEDHTRLPIMLTGLRLKEEDILIGIEAGADLSLRENFHPQVFVARIRSLLRRSEFITAA